MANEEQLPILKQDVETWNQWRSDNPENVIELIGADLSEGNLTDADLGGANLSRANLSGADLRDANLRSANLWGADLNGALLMGADLRGAKFDSAGLRSANLSDANLSGATLDQSRVDGALLGYTIVGDLDLRGPVGLENVKHSAPSRISTDTFVRSNGRIPEAFLRGCGLSDWEIESVKLYNPDLTNEERNQILYKIYELQASQAIQVSPLFISYSHADSEFVDKLGKGLGEKGVRYWRDIHQMKAGRIETQIDRGIRQNPTVLLVLSEHSLGSDWVEHEVRTARALAKELGRDTLCPVALGDSWKSSRWPKRIMEQIMEYNILDFSAWREDSQFDGTFQNLIDGLELFYKG